jgi:branched-subunit amino acid transport protein
MTLAWTILIVGALATYTWRGLGVLLSGQIDADGPVFRWVGCVAFAVLAGMIARMILLPVGPLTQTDWWVRLGATAAAVAAFYLSRRNVPLAIAVGGVGLSLLALVDSQP